MVKHLTFVSLFTWGDKVIVDGGDVVAVVTALRFDATGTSIQISWWHNGILSHEWVDEWRVTFA